LELHVVERALQLQEAGWKVVVMGESDAPILEHARRRGCTTADVHVRMKYLDVMVARRMAALIRTSSVDLIMVCRSADLSTALLARRMSRRACRVLFFSQMQSGVVKRDWFHDRVYGALDHAIMMTRRMRDDLAANTVMPRERISVLSAPVDTARFTPATPEQRRAVRAELGIPEHAHVAICVARFDPQKDQETLLRAWKGLPGSAWLVFVGDDTIGEEGYRDRMIARADELGIRARCVFVPFRPDVERLMHAADIFVLPSLSETFGIVYIEALASGLVVLGTDAGGVPEIIDHGVNGFLFPPSNSDALHALLQRVLTDDALRSAMAHHARFDAVERFDRKRNAQQFVSICHAIVTHERKSA
jgi:glycosyltransferase involved in cell wall biosynthesis